MRPDASKRIAKATPKSGPNVVLIGAVVALAVVLAVVVAIVIGNNSQSGASASGSAVPTGVVGPRLEPGFWLHAFDQLYWTVAQVAYDVNGPPAPFTGTATTTSHLH
jgi:hypothetical protein